MVIMNDVKKYCAFLRNIRINGQVLRMTDIRDIFRQAGMSDVAQVIASGIISFGSAIPKDSLQGILRQALESHYGDSVDIVIKESGEVYGTIANYNLFMMCETPNTGAFRTLPEGFSFRLCRRDELEVWKHVGAEEPYIDFLTDLFEQIYARRQDEFFRRCTFVCNPEGAPVATCYLWLAYEKINTVGLFRVLPEYEGRGIGRALLSEILRDAEYPVYVHTHPTSPRAVKLYSDFGFRLVDNPVVGDRVNHVKESLSLLKEFMPESDFQNLKVSTAPQSFLDAVNSLFPAQF